MFKKKPIVCVCVCVVWKISFMWCNLLLVVCNSGSKQYALLSCFFSLSNILLCVHLFISMCSNIDSVCCASGEKTNRKLITQKLVKIKYVVHS